MWKSIKAYLIDRDGVLVKSPGCVSIPGAKIWIQKVVKKNSPFLIASNHTLSSPEKAAQDLINAGFEINSEQVFTPLSALSKLFQMQNPGRVFVWGTAHLEEFVRQLNIQTVNDSSANTILMGFCRKTDCRIMSLMIKAIVKNKATLLALHKNRLFADDQNNIEPGLGAWVSAIEYATGVEARIIGKPNPEYFKTALQMLKAKAKETVMISDDPTSDLCGAKQLGIKTVFVLSGKYPDTQILNQIEPELRPDIILDSIKNVPI